MGWRDTPPPTQDMQGRSGSSVVAAAEDQTPPGAGDSSVPQTIAGSRGVPVWDPPSRDASPDGHAASILLTAVTPGAARSGRFSHFICQVYVRDFQCPRKSGRQEEHQNPAKLNWGELELTNKGLKDYKSN